MSDKWFSVVTDPLGFAGFALFVIASVLTRVKSKGFFDARTKAGIFVMGLVCVVGGFALAYVRSGASDGGGRGVIATGSITQDASNCSNAVIANGNVTIGGGKPCN